MPASIDTNRSGSIRLHDLGQRTPTAHITPAHFYRHNLHPALLFHNTDIDRDTLNSTISCRNLLFQVRQFPDIAVKRDPRENRCQSGEIGSDLLHDRISPPDEHTTVPEEIPLFQIRNGLRQRRFLDKTTDREWSCAAEIHIGLDIPVPSFRS